MAFLYCRAPLENHTEGIREFGVVREVFAPRLRVVPIRGGGLLLDDLANSRLVSLSAARQLVW